MPKKKVIRARVDPFRLVSQGLDYAIERGMNRHDKYSERELTLASRDLLSREIESSFWIWADDNGVEFK